MVSPSLPDTSLGGQVHPEYPPGSTEHPWALGPHLAPPEKGTASCPSPQQVLGRRRGGGRGGVERAESHVQRGLDSGNVSSLPVPEAGRPRSRCGRVDPF